jgi:hypothetical protein
MMVNPILHWFLVQFGVKVALHETVAGLGPMIEIIG